MEALKRIEPRLTISRQAPALLLSLGLDFMRAGTKQNRNDVAWNPYTGRPKHINESFWERNEADLLFILAEAKHRYLELVKVHHPDRGGDTETMAKLNVIWGRLEYLFQRKGITL